MPNDWVVVQVPNEHMQTLLDQGFVLEGSPYTPDRIKGCAVLWKAAVFDSAAVNWLDGIPYLVWWPTHAGAYDGKRCVIVDVSADGLPVVEITLSGSIDGSKLRHARAYLRMRNAAKHKLEIVCQKRARESRARILP